MSEGNGILLRVFGPFAGFFRPEMKVEAVTYEVMTPTAARGILESIYWKPEMEWIVDGIYVLNKINCMSYKWNGVKEKINVQSVLNGNQTYMDASASRDQRYATVLRNVDYVIKAHFKVVSGEDNAAKHLAMFVRRALKGQYFSAPYFGCREFFANFELVRQVPSSELAGSNIDLGYMLHSINYETYQPAFFNAKLVNGFMEIPSFNSSEVKK
ncbi:MAG: type I-C CRISPR-associated protein Cas5c [Bacteroidales bacterium]